MSPLLIPMSPSALMYLSADGIPAASLSKSSGVTFDLASDRIAPRPPMAWFDVTPADSINDVTAGSVAREEISFLPPVLEQPTKDESTTVTSSSERMCSVSYTHLTLPTS